MSKKNKQSVLVKWKTKSHWYDVEQSVNRNTIKPKDGPLEGGQSVRVLFSRIWYNAEMSEAWTETKTTAGFGGLQDVVVRKNHVFSADGRL